MVDKNLLDKVGRLGFPMMAVEEDLDAEQVLADVVKSQDTRLWEAFPVLAANVLERYSVSVLEEVEKLLGTESDRQAYRELQFLTLALYKLYRVQNTWTADRWKKSSSQDAVFVNDLRKKLVQGDDLTLAGKSFSASRLKTNFENYFETKASGMQKFRSKLEEYSLEYALSQVFSPKQKELFYKRLHNEKMSKTEKEYYSRAVKRKVQALANDGLHDLARKVLE